MRVVRSPKALAVALSKARKRGSRIGFVPTMGFLHEGHFSLVRRARRETHCLVVSIFVNPLQFGPKEDLKCYPRDLGRDVRGLKKEKVDLVFVPSVKAVYPNHFKDFVEPGPLANTLCGPRRPGHFRGVATVVKRLFDMVRPDVAYFGQKDYQQARIIQEMVGRLRLPIGVKICPTVRERDGLAMSSRNIYLLPSERIRARAIFKSLQLAKRLLVRDRLNPRAVEKKVKAFLKSFADKIDYVKVVGPGSLKPLKKLEGRAVVAIACFLGKARLIDNLLVQL